MRYSVRAEGSSEALLSSEEGGSVVLVGSGQPMKAFTAALKTMKQGERASLKIKPECEASHPGSLLADFCDHAALPPGRGASSCALCSYACSGQTGSAWVPANLMCAGALPYAPYTHICCYQIGTEQGQVRSCLKYDLGLNRIPMSGDAEHVTLTEAPAPAREES